MYLTCRRRRRRCRLARLPACLPQPSHAHPSAVSHCTTAGMASLSKEVVTGLNTLKKGADPPLRPDDQLPEWLWELAEPEKTLNELRRMKPDDIKQDMVGGWVTG